MPKKSARQRQEARPEALDAESEWAEHARHALLSLYMSAAPIVHGQSGGQQKQGLHTQALTFAEDGSEVELPDRARPRRCWRRPCTCPRRTRSSHQHPFRQYSSVSWLALQSMLPLVEYDPGEWMQAFGL